MSRWDRVIYLDVSRERRSGRNVGPLRATEREGLSSRTGSMRALGMRENQGATRRTENAGTALERRGRADRGWQREKEGGRCSGE